MPNLTLDIAAPYSEGAISAIEQSARDDGLLNVAIRPGNPLGILGKRVAQALGREDLALRLGRSSVSSRTRQTNSFIEALRLVTKAAGSKYLDSRQMYVSSALFGRSASRLSCLSAPIVIGMPGACKEIFENKTDGTLRVFHAVNAHPEYQN
jgi:hypothetical protein